MADDTDRSLEDQQKELERSIAAARRDLPELHTGECMDCGEEASNLRESVCTPCRNLIEANRLRYARV
jgi:hypothetical protein